MAGSTISNSVSVGIVLESGAYPSPLTVTSSGIINSASYGVYSPPGIGQGSLFNDGTIAAVTVAVDLAGGYVLNAGDIQGGVYGLDVSGGSAVNAKLIEAADIGVAINGGGSITNQGYVYGSLSGGFVSAGSLINSGTVMGYTFGLTLIGGQTSNSGTVAGEHFGIALTGTASFLNSGVVLGGVAGVDVIGGGSLTNAGTIGGGRYAVFSTVSFALTLNPGAVFEGAVVDESQNGLLVLEGAGGTIAGLGNALSGFGTIEFGSGSQWLVAGNTAGLAAGEQLSGFSTGDAIELTGFTVNPRDTRYVSGVGLELTDTAGYEITLDIEGTFQTANFIVEAVPDGTEIAVCFLAGTRILTPAGEVAVEALAVGDAVVTRFGGYRKLKWVGRQRYDRRFVQGNLAQIPVRIGQNAFGGGWPRRDLYVSPGHSLLIGGVLVLASALVNGVSVTQDEAPQLIDYYQLEFETHDCVMAEGIWAESYADTPDWRRRFHNWPEFYALYPAHEDSKRQVLCAERPMAGEALAAALAPVVARAGRWMRPGRLRGFVDEVSATGLVRGWAQDDANLDLPVWLEVVARKQVLGRVLACDYRADVAATGLGRGWCGFEFCASAGFSKVRDVVVRRVGDGAELVMAQAAPSARGRATGC